MNSDRTAPTDAPALLASGLELMRAGRLPEAVAVLTHAVTTHPTDLGSRMALGAALRGQRAFEAAAIQFLKASRIAPHAIEPRVALAQSMADAGKTAEALHVISQSVAAMPGSAALWNSKGTLERRMGMAAESEVSFQTACDLEPQSVEYLNNLAVAFRAQGRIDPSIALYRRALAVDPGHARVHGNLGNALDAAGRATEAEPHLRQAVALAPEDIDAAHNLAAHLIRTERQDEAVPLLEGVVTGDPTRWDALTNLGVALLAVGRTDVAERCYRRALALRPEVPETHYDLAWVLLLTGRWDEGWREYEWRWRLPTFGARRPEVDMPEWDGRELPAGTLLVYAEQGFGDAIQFSRFAVQAKARVSRVVVSCPRPLVGLLSTIAGIDEVVPDDAPLPSAHMCVAMMSLPRLFATTPDTVPMPAAYLPLPTPRIALPRRPRARIGFVWAGSPANKIDRQRSCDVSYFKRLMAATAADFVSLQVGPRAGDLDGSAIENLVLAAEGVVHDFLDTAALVGQLDLVIGVDTAVMHLAAALGRPAWILVSFMPDYRWLLDRADSPWYGSVRLFRQRIKGDWNQVFSEVDAALKDWLSAR